MADMQLIRRPACGASNRVPREKFEQGLEPVCGRRKTPLPAGGKPAPAPDATFAAEVESSPLPVLLDMWAPWCGPCRMMEPVIGELVAEMAGRVRVAKLNVDENPATAARINARSIPTLLAPKRAGRLIALWARSPIQRWRGGWNEYRIEGGCGYDRGNNGRHPARIASRPHSAQRSG